MSSLQMKQLVVQSVAPLGISATFTQNVDVNQFQLLCGVIFSDQAGTLFLKALCPSGTYRTVFTQAVTAGAAIPFSHQVVAPRYSIVYTNGGVAQGSFDFAVYTVSVS